MSLPPNLNFVGNPWLTVSQYILGIKPEYDGLLIDPCLPLPYGTYKVHRRFRDAEYHFIIKYSGKNQKVFVPYEPGTHELTITL